MPGGFLSGLGQGLQSLSGTVQNHMQGKRQDERQAEDTRRWTLEQELAEKDRRTRANQWGVDDLNRQGAMMQQQAQFEASQDAAKRREQNAYGMDMMRMDADKMHRDQQYELDKKRAASYDIIARNQGGGGGYDRMIGDQRIIQAMGPLTAELKQIQDRIAGDFMRPHRAVPTADDRLLDERAAAIRMKLDAYQAQLEQNLIPKQNKAALDTALSGVAGGGGIASVAQEPQSFVPTLPGQRRF